jgi:hypothetical protein
MSGRMKLIAIAGVMLAALMMHNLRAQELCEVLAREVWEEVTNNCDDTDTENACYGNDSLIATFIEDTDSTVFKRPGDLIELVKLHTAHTLPFDETEEEWGIGHFQIQSRLFGGSSDEPVVILMAGDVVVENAAEPGSDLNPMQAFNFQTGGTSSCREAPNTVFIQSPKDVKVDLVINSTPIRLGSTIVIGTDQDEQGRDFMWFAVIEGTLTLYPDTPNARVLRAGQYTTTLLSNQQGQDLEGQAVLEGGLVPVLDRATGSPVVGVNNLPFYRQVPVTPFAEAKPLTFDGEGFTGWDAYTFINLIPQALINYPVSIPDASTQPQSASSSSLISPTASPTGNPAENWCYTGGLWAGKCNHSDPAINAWYWNAGWYYAAFAAGKISSIPPEYRNEPTPISTTASSTPVSATSTATVLPVTPTETPLPATPTETPIIVNTATETPVVNTPTSTPGTVEVCVDLTPIGVTGSVLLNTALPAQNLELHDDLTCSNPSGIFFALVLAPDIATAQQTCTTAFGLPTATDYTAAHPDLWRCTLN